MMIILLTVVSKYYGLFLFPPFSLEFKISLSFFCSLFPCTFVHFSCLLLFVFFLEHPFFSELLELCTMYIVRYSRNQGKQRFGKGSFLCSLFL